MGNWWTGASAETLQRMEQELFRMNGVPDSAITSRNVRLGGGDDENYIHEIRVAGVSPGLPTLVMIHGYMAGGGQFAKMAGYLRNYYEVITIDLLGMGSSGRPSGLQLDSFEAAVNFFVNSIHEWTQLAGLNDGNKFYLLGHSLGGMIAGHYALVHHAQIEKLILMSAVGITMKPSHMQEENFVSNRQTRASRYGAEWVNENWSTNTFSPADIYRVTGYHLSKRMFANGLARRIRGNAMNDEEKEALMEYILQMAMRPKSSELCVYQMLAPMAFSERPLCLKLPELPCQVAFMYGEYDWVNRDIADELIQGGKVQGEVFQTGDSGHHLYVEAAVECVSSCLKFTHGEQVSNEFICSI